MEEGTNNNNLSRILLKAVSEVCLLLKIVKDRQQPFKQWRSDIFCVSDLGFIGIILLWMKYIGGECLWVIQFCFFSNNSRGHC